MRLRRGPLPGLAQGPAWEVRGGGGGEPVRHLLTGYLSQHATASLGGGVAKYEGCVKVSAFSSR